MNEEDTGRLSGRTNALERQFERLDERMGSKLGKDDATMLMEYAASGDSKLREDFISRFNDFRHEVREAFKHNEKETGSSIYKAITEAEARLNISINALNTTLNAINAALNTPPERRGWHPMVAYGGSGAGLMALVAFAIYVMTGGKLGMGGFG